MQVDFAMESSGTRDRLVTANENSWGIQKDISKAREQRDLYLEMKRAEDPDFGCIPLPALRSAVNMSSMELCSTQTKVPYECDTQRTESLDELFVGIARGMLFLWENGSVINWIARSDGYPTFNHAMTAAVAVYRAAQRWNEVMDGRVTFRYVTKFDDAAFQVSYGGDLGGTLASAFFPNQYQRSLNDIRVYATQFADNQLPLIVNTMLHELGHVLGLRHEHSHSGIPGWLPPEDTANGAESIVYGVRNPRSVMAYYRGQDIQPSDESAIREAYDKLSDGSVIEGQGRFTKVKKVVRRVAPNN